ncbi:hypothetical protein HHX38_08575 [Streptomyces sp. PKU-MA01144]|uniref:hypothetical protein n=1 Tax=Streptomyces sp. PKU-MA01144 TaxID=2729138 RepID=UPI00147E6654|nr:hypothetical protein [Streptomyces sp. PKU-MA01144]NNJ04188.1 hypothetical protein [Streptomyces sp. PKU-MA01144]
MPELITRRGWLLAEIRTRGGRWTAQRAAAVLQQSPWPTSGRNTARKDLRALSGRGDLTAWDDRETQRRSYTPNTSRKAAA